MSINFTTNGTLLTEEFLQRIAGHYGQIRLSLYEDNHWPESAALLARSGARFGVNWLIIPAELPTLETTFARLLELGVRDILLIGYKGADRTLHLAGEHFQRLSDFVNHAYQQVGAWVHLKLDVCWGESLPEVPRLFVEEDCGAGNHILSITSDRHVKPCSFFPIGKPFETVDDLRRYWLLHRTAPQAADVSGCARLPGRGLMP